MNVTPDPIAELLALAQFVSRRRELDALLEECVRRAAFLVDSPRATIQVLDPAGTHLIARCRAGEPVHTETKPFAVGEGLSGWVVANVQPVRLDEASSDERFAQRSTGRSPIRSFLAVPLVAGNACLGVLSFAHVLPGRFTAAHEHYAMLIASIAAPHIELARLARLSDLDPLTGLLNRRGLHAQLRTSEAARCAVVVADLDHFKSINDRFGHATGDRVIVTFADILAGVVRRGDSVARIGGEEFVVVLPGASRDAAEQIAERARQRFEVATVEGPEGRVPVSASFGVTEVRPGESLEHATQRADRAMYEAKRLGRNRVVSAA